MKKILVIANLHHASPRIPGILSNLPDDFHPVVVTPPLKNDRKGFLLLSEAFKKKVKIAETLYYGDIFERWRKVFRVFGFSSKESMLEQAKSGGAARGRFVDFLFKFYLTVFAYPDEEKKWKKPALESTSKLLNKEKFDIILSSSSPVTTHIVAKILKKKYKLPWVADLRDLWSQNCNYPYFGFRKLFDKKIETETLRYADALITVSAPMAEQLKGLYKDKKVFVVTNGFEPEIVNIPPAPLSKKFTITYTGQIYDGGRDPEKILICLRELIDEKEINPIDLELNFYGPKKNWLDKKIADYQLSEIAKQYGVISRKKAIKKQRESQILLKFNWEKPSHKGAYSGKIFEYLAARRPILATGGFSGDVTEELLKKTKAGIFAPTKEDIKRALKNFYSQYKKYGKVLYNGDLEEVSKYNYKEIAKKFSEILTCLPTGKIELNN